MAATSPFFILFLHFLLIFSFFPSSLAASSNTTFKPYPAFFIFGDSLVDVGNNNYIFTIARANKLPFGIDFPQGPTGRFCNGKIVPDFICELISLPFPPPYLAPTTKGNALLQGVNYASAAGGILRSSGYLFIGRVDFDTQIQWFSNNIQELQQLLGVSAAQSLISQSLYSTTFGPNDYLNNYLLPGSPVSQQYTTSQYQQVLLDKFSTQLTQLYNLGVRTLAVVNLGPLGCIPEQLAVRSVNGECSDYVNGLAMGFNQGLDALVDGLNSQLPGAQFVVIDTFTPVLNYRNDPTKYGFKYGDKGCCGGGRFNGLVICLPIITPCPDRADYVFWDPFHPTQAVNNLLANSFYQILLSRIGGGP